MRRVTVLATVLLLAAATAGATVWWIPAAAHAEGAQGSVWRTKLVLRSFDDESRTVTVTLLPQGTDNSAMQLEQQVTLPAGSTLQLDDAVQQLFGVTGAGGLRVEAPSDRLLVTSRTYNLSDEGTFGQSIPAVRDEAVVPAHSSAILVGLAGTDDFRTNVGWVNADGEGIEVMVRLYAASGQLLSERTFHERPLGQTQFELFGRMGVTPVADAYAAVIANGRVQPYASVVAGGSNDPIYVNAMTGVDLATEVLVPAVARAGGAFGTVWTSDVWVLNAGWHTTAVTAELWLQDQANTTPQQVPIADALAPGEQVRIEDVIGGVFALDDTQGALVIRTETPVLVTSRTFNTTTDGTFGQFIAGRSFASLGGVGETTLLTGVVHGDDFRTNVGLVATAGGSRVALTLRGGDGSELASTEVVLLMGEQIQKSVAALFGPVEVGSGSVEATLLASDDPRGRVAAYVSVVDNVSTDPTFVSAASAFAAEADLEQVQQSLLITTYALAAAAEASSPRLVGKATVECIDVVYEGDTIRPGDSPIGKCWSAAITFDDCFIELPTAMLALGQNGTAAADVCIVDGYPSTLDTDLVTVVDDLATGERHEYSVDATQAITFDFESSQVRPVSVHLGGAMQIEADGLWVSSWSDLVWQSNATGFELFPSGTILAEFPYQTEVSTTARVTGSFDGTEWVLVEVALGYWKISFWYNLVTGEVQFV